MNEKNIGCDIRFPEAEGRLVFSAWNLWREVERVTLKTSILRESFQQIFEYSPHSIQPTTTAALQVLSSSWGLLQMFLYPIYCTNDLSTALHLCTMETALWDCDFCPASCQDVPKEAEKYRPEFLGTHFAFALNQSSELCLHRLQREKSSTDFSV